MENSGNNLYRHYHNTDVIAVALSQLTNLFSNS